jgi:hypothetical protein
LAVFNQAALSDNAKQYTAKKIFTGGIA